jgi:hypothetical protein
MSQSFYIPATSRTPEVSLDEAKHCALIAGECYPEDAEKFFNSVNQALESYFSKGFDLLNLEIKLVYFNSSSARALMELMDDLEARSAQGVSVRVEWFYDQDDDITKEFVEDIVEDYKHMELIMTPNLN